MKKVYLLLVLSFLLQHAGVAQNGISAFAPLNRALNANTTITIGKDTAGLIWFAAYDSTTDTIYVTNENNSVFYSITLPAWASGAVSDPVIMPDSRNDIWVINSNISPIIYRIHNALPQAFNLPLHDTIFDMIESISLADNHHGIDYFLYQVYSNSSSQDSTYLATFDGTHLSTINLASVVGYDIPAYPINFKLLCDYSGNAYLIVDTTHIFKFDGTAWTVIPENLGSIYIWTALFNYSNQLFLSDHSRTISIISTSGQMTAVFNLSAGNLMDADLFLSADSSTWLGSSVSGLLKYTTDSFRLQVDYTQLFYPPYCRPTGKYLFDRYGNIWMTSSCYTNALVYSFGGPNLINGTVFLDANQNGVQDSGEVGIPGLTVTQSPVNSATSTDSNGRYEVAFSDTWLQHKVSFNCPAYFHLTTPASYNANIDTGVQCCFNFGIAPNGPIQDLQINAAPPSAIKGYNNHHWLNYSNNGTTTISDTITYNFDPAYTYLGSVPPADVMQGHQLKWAYQNLQPFETRSISAVFYLDSNVAIDTLLNDTAIIGPLNTDTTRLDNVYALQQTIMGPFMANEKTVSPAGAISPGDKLTYTIYFQNKGTDTATTVVIRDTLNRYLDLSTFKLLGSSNPVSYQITGNGALQGTFSNILLPDSTDNPTGSVGYITYSVQTDGNLPLGTVIRNTAYIYLDSAAAIVTNTTNNFYAGNGIFEVSNNAGISVKAYPNPFSDVTHIVVNGLNEKFGFELYDVTGRLQQSIPSLDNSQFDVRKGTLSKGVYLYRIIVTGKAAAFGKLVVE